MGDANIRRPEILRGVALLTAVACCLIALVGACGPDDGGAGGGGSDAGPDSGTDGDAGDDGGADTDTDTDTDTSGIPLACDPRICDDGCYRAGKDYGECVGALCECFGNRDMGGCGCVAAGNRGSGGCGFLAAVLSGTLP